jgi:hypothetical protein
MVERVRAITISVEIDTNKETIRRTFTSVDEAWAWLIDFSTERACIIETTDAPPYETTALIPKPRHRD